MSNPLAYLSAYSIARKALHNIPIDSLDLPVVPAYIDSVRASGCIILNKSRWLNAVTIKFQDSSQLKQVLKLPFVKSIKAVGNLVSHGMCEDASLSPFNPPDTLLYGAAFHQLQMLRLPLLHAYGFKGDGIRIAMFDIGFNRVDKWAAFDSLLTLGRFLDFYDFVRHRKDSAFYWHDHGAMTLSAIAANQPDLFVGAAPNVSIALYHTEDAATENPIEEDNWCSAADRADSLGVDIISSSLGYTTFDSSYFNLGFKGLNGRKTHISMAATIAARKGILVCNSAGNEGDKAWHFVGAPADADSILAVGSVDAYDTISGFSSRGPTYDHRTKPDVVAMGENTALISPANGGVTHSNGTSFSAPIIAGAAACLWQICPAMSNMEIRKAIIESADRYRYPGNVYGYGIPDVVKAAGLIYQEAKCIDRNPSFNYLAQQFITLYPNPAGNIVYLAYIANDLTPVKLTWFDITGRSYLEQVFTPALRGVNRVLATNVSQWPTGVYLARISVNGGTVTKRFVVAHGAKN